MTLRKAGSISVVFGYPQSVDNQTLAAFIVSTNDLVDAREITYSSKLDSDFPTFRAHMNTDSGI